MSVLLFIDSLGAGGAQRQLVGLASLLKLRGYDVSVVCYHENSFYVDKLQASGVPYVYLKKAENAFLRIWHVARYIRKVKPDVVISYLETPSICACFSHLFNKNFRLIVSERNTTQHTGRNEKIRFKLFRTADYVVPNAFAQEKYIKEVFPFLANKVVTIPNFVDLDYFFPAVKDRINQIPEILVAATIWPSKNTLGFIEAVSKLAAEGLIFHVSWYGKSSAYIDYFKQCQELIDKLGISNFIELKEKTTEIKDKYQNADYFCLPSFYEGTPNVICEAMACGLPVVCSDVCDNGRYVKEGVNGFLFNPKDITSIYEAVKRVLVLDRDEYALYSRRSREIAEGMFSKDKFVNSYLRLIE